MKKRYLYCAILSITVCITSCQDYILDKKPLDVITEEATWNDEGLMDAFLSNLYRGTTVLVQDCSGLVNTWGTDALSETTSWDREFANSELGGGPFWVTQLSDEAKTGWYYREAGDKETFKTNGITIDGGVLEYWDGPYKVIRNLNDFISRVSDSPASEEFKQKRIAEARFLRVFNYFAMVKRYGGVPIITKVIALDASEEELYPKRNSEQEVYDFILEELDNFANDLPDNAELGRPSKWAALALKSRVALYAGSIAQFGKIQLDGLLGIPSNLSTKYYQIAYDAAKEIIDNSPHALFEKYTDKVKNFRQLFIEKGNIEAIFVKQHDGLNGLQEGGNGWSYDFLQCPTPQSWGKGNIDGPYLEMAEEFDRIDGSSGKLDRSVLSSKEWTIEELWGNRDPRFYATIYTQDTEWKGHKLGFYPGGSENLLGNDFRTGLGVMKYLDENENNMEGLSMSSTDYMVFRLGEMYLNLAEAAFELGNKEGEALNAINELRERAGVKLLSDITRDVIRHERKIELAFEGHRYWDLRRWRIATTELSKSFSGIRYDLGSQEGKFKITVIEDIHGDVQPKFEEHYYYLPVTLKRTTANPNLKENPGYE